MSTPTVTVIMSVYNQELYVEESIDSILAQTYTDFELLIIDDGSTDTSDRLVRQYDDPRIRYLQNGENLGIVATSNRGLAEAMGKYIARLDSDDIAHKDRLRLQVDFLEANPDIDFLASYYQTLESRPRTVRAPTDPREIADTLMVGNCFGHSTVMYRRERFAEKGLVYPNVGGGAEDYAFYLICAPHVRMATLPEVLVYYRVHESQISQVQNDLQTQYANEERRAYVEHLLGRSMSSDEALVHDRFCSKQVLTADELRASAVWIEELARVRPGGSDALMQALRNEFRRSARERGPGVFTTYLRIGYRPRFGPEELLFMVSTTLSWVKLRLFSLFRARGGAVRA